MKRLKLYLSCVCAAVVFLCAAGGEAAVSSEGKRRVVLSTTFPIRQITRNVARERDGVDVQLMLPSQLGCPHDYVLTPRDMRRIAEADVLVVNGLGMEEFLGAPVMKANPSLRIIDSSVGIDATLQFVAEHEPHHDSSVSHDHAHAHENGLHHHHSGVNPHLFASPRMAARLSVNIAEGLAAADLAGADVYRRNGRAYADSMTRLADDMEALGRRLRNTAIVEPHGVFDYLARDMGLEIVAVMQPHGQEPSAAEMLAIVDRIREKKAGAIFTEPQYSDKAGRKLAAETGIPVAMLDPVASGPEDAPLDYYESVMRRNMKTLENVLGLK